MEQSMSMRVRIQKFGNFLSSMVMPNIGVFIAWGLLTAMFIPTGWMPNEALNHLVGPTIKYLMPVLIGYTGGTLVYGKRGGAIGAAATMGVVIGADITMLIGGMIMGPLAAWLMKKLDGVWAGHVKPGMEMLVDNFSLGILGAILMIAGYLVVEPIFTFILQIMTAGVNFIIAHDMLPFVSLFVQPAQVLFLNNAINHGIMVPIGIEQAATTGKSILFLVEANGGVWTGAVLAFALFGRGMAKKSAPAATLIMFFGGIAEVCFPYVLAKPKTIIGPICGNIAALFTLSILGGGTVAAVSPGSFLALLAMTPKGSFLANLAGYFVALVVTCAVTGILLLRDKEEAKEVEQELRQEEQAELSNHAIAAIAPVTDTVRSIATLGSIKEIAFACDAGMGSSVMGVSKMKDKLRKAGLDIHVVHSAVKDLTDEPDIIVTSAALAARVKDTIKKYDKAIPVFAMDNLLNDADYDAIIEKIRQEKVMKVKPIFSRQNIVLGAAFSNKTEAIRACGQILVDNGYVKPAYIDDMLLREKTASVYVGNHLAIPHGVNSSEQHILSSGISFLQVPGGVKFGDETAYILIGVAGKDGQHIQILSSVATIFSDIQNVRKLKDTTDKDFVYQMLSNIKVASSE